MVKKGKVIKAGDNVNTDIISPPQYMELSISEAAPHAMEAVDPDFAQKASTHSILVAGANFGSGSSRETAPLTLKYLGIQAIVAKFFARIFYRNAINLGLAAIECDETDRISQEDEIEIELERGVIRNLTKGEEYVCSRIPDHILELIEEGGIVASLRKQFSE